jgi:uncharacterized membrane protein
MDLRKHGAILFQGLAVIAPIIITVYVAARALWWLDATVRSGLEYIGSRPVPGVGIVFGVCVIYLIGLLARYWFFNVLLGLGEKVVERIPLVKTVYSSVRDLLQFLEGTKKGGVKPAALKSEDGNVSVLGLITQDAPGQFLPGGEGKVGIYVPFSYSLGGFTMYVPRGSVQELEGMSVADLLKLCLTAGVSPAAPAAAPRPAEARSQQTGPSPNTPEA